MTATHELRFLVLALPNVPWVEFLASVENIEDLGFDVVGVADHFVDWTNPPRPWFEAWTLLAALARETKRIRITTTVSQIPLRPPAMFARQALTVDHLSDGRLELGLGIGLPIDPSYEMMGVPNWTPKERVDRFGEYVEVIGRMLSNEVTTYNGRYYEIEGAVMNPRPVQSPRPPLTIAAMGTRMLAYCTRTMNAASLQIQFELDEAAYVSGVSKLVTFRRVFLPIMLPAIFYSALMVGMLAARDLTLPLVMNTGKSPVVSVMIFDLQTNGEQNAAAALAHR